MTTLKIGDVVQIASKKGPIMTVAEISTETIKTLWFRGDELNKGNFPADSLIVIVKESV